MRGLKTQEGEKFTAFFRMVQEEARKHHSVFFLECGEGNDFSADSIEGEDLRGWLIPENQADQFERVWLNGVPDEGWEQHHMGVVERKAREPRNPNQTVLNNLCGLKPCPNLLRG